jgi:hypothetical protein
MPSKPTSPAVLKAPHRSRGRTAKSYAANVSPLRPTPINVVSSDFDGTEVTLTFDGPVVLRSTPKYTAGSFVVTSARAASATSVALTFDGDVTGLALVIPFGDPAISNLTGGLVNPTTLNMPVAPAAGQDEAPLSIEAKPVRKAA